jgi:hypothetical protein
MRRDLQHLRRRIILDAEDVLESSDQVEILGILQKCGDPEGQSGEDQHRAER